MGAILYGNVLEQVVASPSLVITDESVGSNAENLFDGKTATSSTFATGATRSVIIDFGSAQSLGAGIGIARHNLGTVDATLAVAGSNDNSSYTTLATFNPSDDKVQFDIGSISNYRYVRLQVSGHTSTALICCVSIGNVLTLERDQKGGFISPRFADNDKVISNMTVGQNLAGITIKRMPKTVTLKLPYYTESFYTDWESVLEEMKSKPLFLYWDKLNAKEAFFGWLDKKMPQPAYSKNITNYGYFDSTINLMGITE